MAPKAKAKGAPKAPARPRAKGKAKARAKARVRGRGGALRRPASRGDQGGEAAPAPAELWDRGQELDAGEVPLKKLGAGVKVVAPKASYYLQECQVAFVVRGIEVKDDEAYLQAQLRIVFTCAAKVAIGRRCPTPSSTAVESGGWQPSRRSQVG